MIDSDPNGPFRYPVSDIRDQDAAEPGITPSQTVGPYVHIGLTWDDGEKMVPEDTPGAVDVTFTVIDGAGHLIKDAMIEIWQADENGIYPSPLDERAGTDAGRDGFRGLGRGMVPDSGELTFRTVRPGAVPAPDGGMEAPHLNVGVFARGMLERLYTRLYFPEEVERNGVDPVLSSVPETRRSLLVASATEDGNYRMDVVMQHEDPDHETPFFAL
jgi:protocatechuate 3,4-dioxygenase alpha subunit